MLVDAVVVLLHMPGVSMLLREGCIVNTGEKGKLAVPVSHTGMSCSTREIFACRQSSKLFCFISLPCDLHTSGLGKLLNMS